jgi:hypothetical protein
MDKLFGAGALDVFLENIIMKKGRPAIKLTVILEEKNMADITDIIFLETPSIGIRFHSSRRNILGREIVKVKTHYGIVRYKISRYKGAIVTATPEYEDLKLLAKKNNISIKKLSAGLPAPDKLLVTH